MRVRRNLDFAKVEGMMAAVGTGEVALLASQRRFEKLAEGVQRIVPSVALLVLHECVQGGDGNRVAVIGPVFDDAGERGAVRKVSLR